MLVLNEFREVGDATPVRGSGDTTGGPYRIPSLLFFFLTKINSPQPKSVLLKSPVLTETIKKGRICRPVCSYRSKSLKGGVGKGGQEEIRINGVKSTLLQSHLPSLFTMTSPVKAP